MAARPTVPPARRSRAWSDVALVGATTTILLAALTGCTDGGATSPTATPSASESPTEETSPDPTEDATTAPPETPGPTGSREDPFAAGDPVVAGGWTTTIGPTDVDAWTGLGAELNDVELADLAPPAGTSYVVAPMTVTYADGVPTNLGSFEVSYVGPSGTSYPVIGSTCRLALDDLFPTSDVYDQPEVTGRVCTDVPTADAPGGTWRVALNIYDDATSAASTDYEGYVAVD